MASKYPMNTDHWSKMRMNVIKNSINLEKRGRVLSWEKHQKIAAERELEAAIRGARSLPKNQVGAVHNFQDVLAVELNGYLPGSGYFRRRTEKELATINGSKKKFAEYRTPSLTNSQYTLMTLPTDPRSDQTRSRVPVLQCRGRI